MFSIVWTEEWFILGDEEVLNTLESLANKKNFDVASKSVKNNHVKKQKSSDLTHSFLLGHQKKVWIKINIFSSRIS